MLLSFRSLSHGPPGSRFDCRSPAPRTPAASPTGNPPDAVAPPCVRIPVAHELGRYHCPSCEDLRIDADISRLSLDDREALVAFVGERPSTVLSVHALLSGVGRVWVAGDIAQPEAVLVESKVVPGEPQGFGDPDAIIELLHAADGWWCVESSFENADAMASAFDAQWNLTHRVVDIIHVVERVREVPVHPLVRALEPGEPSSLTLATPELFADAGLAEAAASAGFAFAAVDGDTILGHGSCLAWGRAYADISIQVAGPYRESGIATSAAARACAAATASGVAPIWGCGTENGASRRVAEKLGFVEESRVMFLVREH